MTGPVEPVGPARPVGPVGGTGEASVPDYDPDAVVIRPAATVMLVDDRPDLHVLMLRRSPRQVFATSMWVYPGGAVDAADGVCPCGGLDDVAAGRKLGLDGGGGLAYWVAAICTPPGLRSQRVRAATTATSTC